jgi:hypothetical protein
VRKSGNRLVLKRCGVGYQCFRQLGPDARQQKIGAGVLAV